MPQTTLKTRIRRFIPRLIGIVFGTLWALLAAGALPTGIRGYMSAIACLIGLGLCIRQGQDAAATAQPSLFRSPFYFAAIAFELIAIFAATSILPRLGATDYLYSAVGLIVGLHFIGLWKATGDRVFLAITLGMCLVSLVSMVLPFTWREIGLRYVFLGAGNGLVLWAGASTKR